MERKHIQYYISIITLINLGFLLVNNSQASVKEAYKIHQNHKSNYKNKTIAHALIDGEYYFSAIPYINKYLEDQTNIDKELEEDIETLVVKTGTMAVLNLEEEKLKKFNIPSIHLILGTRLFQSEKYKESFEIISKIPANHKFSVEAELIKGSIKDLAGNNQEALAYYRQCHKKADANKSNGKLDKLKRYYTYLEETCLIREARLEIKNKNYQKSIELYDKIDKRSYKWPYTIIEKSWAHYYLNDYNRSLGLLTTYKSPLLSSYFFPEAEVLTALSYYNLCLYDDSLVVVDHYYDFYRPKSLALKEILNANKNSKTYFLDLYYAEASTRENLNPFIRNLITQTRKQVKFNLDLSSLKNAKDELALIKRLKNQNEFTKLLEVNLNETIKFISSRMNYYIKKEIYQFITDIHRHSYSMFNLKLELLSQKRNQIYNPKKKEDRDRGDERNVKRTAYQYFYNFNGSFWADELGDYSFGLESNCKKPEAPSNEVQNKTTNIENQEKTISKK